MNRKNKLRMIFLIGSLLFITASFFPTKFTSAEMKFGTEQPTIKERCEYLRDWKIIYRGRIRGDRPVYPDPPIVPIEPNDPPDIPIAIPDIWPLPKNPPIFL